MNRIYHGCFTKNADGTNKIILAGEKCLFPTSKCFWNFPENLENIGVKTCSQRKRDLTVSKKDYDQYFKNKGRIHRWITAADSEVYVMKPTDRFYVI